MHFNIRSLFTQILIIAMFTTLAMIPILSTYFVGPTDRIYGYYVDLSKIGISVSYVKVIDRSRVVVVGSVRDVYGVAVLNINNPYEDPVVEDLYPLTGMPTYVATDGFPITRIAVGSDKGEVLVLRIDRGRITKHLYTVLGADFYVEKLYLAKDALGNVKVIAFVVEGGGRGYPCMNCYIYIFDEDVWGILRIGPRVGNATWWGRTLEGMNVQDVAPLAIYNVNGFYYDVSNVVIAYIPQMLKLILNVTYIDATTGELQPLRDALVEVVLVPRESPLEIITYGVNADSKGVARIPVPIDKHRTLIANLTIRKLDGTPLWRYTVVLTPMYVEQLLKISDELPLPTVILPTSEVDKRPALKVYGIPPFLYTKLELYDFSLSPQFYRLKGTANFVLPPSVRDVQFVKGIGEVEAKLLYVDPSAGSTYLAVVSIGAGISRRTFIEDYVGVDTRLRLIDSSTYSDGSYVLVGLNDGRIRVYINEGLTYRLKYIYPMDSPLINIISIPGLEGYTYVAITASGVQVFRVEPYPLPIYRTLTQLYTSVPNFVYGDALPDLSTITLANPSNIVIIRNSDIAVRKRIIVHLDTVLAKDVVININLPGNEDINGTKVVFKYPGGSVTYTPTSSNLTLRNIISEIVYSIDIIPPKQYIYPTSITFELINQTLQILEVSRGLAVVESICCRISVYMDYKEYTVNLTLLDELSGENLIAPIDIYLDDKLFTTTTTNTRFNTLLIYGEHNITIVPSKGYEDAYQSIKKMFAVYEDTEVVIILERKRYNVGIKVVDELTGGPPVAPVRIELANTHFIADPTKYEYSVILPYGTYTVRLNPVKGFENVYQSKEYTISLPHITTYTFTLSRVKHRVDLVLKDPYSVNLIAPLDIYLNGTIVRANITVASVSLDIPYGPWFIEIVPSKGFEGIYLSYELKLNVSSSLKQEVVVPRAMYVITLTVVDIYGKVISPLDVVIEGPITITQRIDPPGRVLQLLLPYGIYNVNVIPFNTSIYLPLNTSLTVDSPQSIMLTIQRARYRLKVTVVDRIVLRGRFELLANGTTATSNVGAYTEVELPYGIYSIQLVPLPQFENIYQPSKPQIISLTSNTSITVNVDRKTYNLRLSVMEGTTPVGNALVDIINEEAGALVTSLPSDPTTGVVETKLPYGVYRILVKHPQYKDGVAVIEVLKDTSYVIQLEPTVVTLILRFLPVIGTLAGIGIAAYVIMKIRAIMAKRLIEEELF